VQALATEVRSLSERTPNEEAIPWLEAIHANSIMPILSDREYIRDLIFVRSYAEQKNYSFDLFMVLLLSLIIIALSIALLLTGTNRNLRSLLFFVKELERGSRPAKLNLDASAEFEDISDSLNKLLIKQDEKISFLKTIGEGIDTKVFAPEKSDIIGNEIKIMAERLKKIQIGELERQTEDNKRRWTSEGITQFAEILRLERENVSELSFLIIQKLVTYLKIEMGTIFLASDSEGEPMLETISAYAYDRRKYIEKTFRFGEGLPGTCALEKQKIYMDEIPDDYSDVISGVGQTKPRYILLVPLKIEDNIFGILELASVRSLENHELDFVDQLAESIASTLLAVKTNEKTAFLLKQSQQQAEKLLLQEEEMKKNVAELENAQEESLKKESEIIGILNAMNESSLVAEYGLNGRFTHINAKFLELFESAAEMILGKNHYEFAQVNIHSPEYKKFWEDLQKGLSISNIELFKLYSGKEIWLQQTYTPIKNKEGKVYKILNIAVNITNAKIQQASLEKQASEIIRQNLEMESLNEAVNSSIIKCELDNEGIIMDANTNFESVSGLNRKEILGRNYRLFLKDMEKDQFEKIWLETLKGKTYQGATRRTKPTGEETWLMSTFSPVKDEDGKIYKIYFLALDITEKKLKYQLLEEANKEIERLRSLNN
jgi:methyl-accepting chemotaxis protein